MTIMAVAISATIALAADETAPASQWSSPENLYYLAQILGVVITVATPLFLRAFLGAMALAKSKTKNELLLQMLAQIEAMAPAVAKAVYEDYVKTLRGAGDDRKLTLEEISEANKRATSKMKEVLGAETVKALSGQGVSLDQYIPGVVGVAVEQAKAMFAKPQTDQIEGTVKR